VLGLTVDAAAEPFALAFSWARATLPADRMRAANSARLRPALAEN